MRRGRRSVAPIELMTWGKSWEARFFSETQTPNHCWVTALESLGIEIDPLNQTEKPPAVRLKSLRRRTIIEKGERDNQYRLTAQAAHDLLKGALDTYAQLHGKTLTEVFLHSRSDISAEEFEGYRSAASDGLKVVGIRVRPCRDGPRLYRPDKQWPVIRGTLWEHSPTRGYLFGSGFKPRLGTYDGWETPVPLQIDIQHGDADIVDVARDILGLTKLNYNTCNAGDTQPVTVKFSDAVGEILVSNPTVTNRQPTFRFYI